MSEQGSFKKSGRLGRLMKMGSLAASVTGSVALRRLTDRLAPEEGQAERQRLNLVENAQKLVRAMGELKGAAMKVGQMLSVMPEQLPPEVAAELARLHKDTPPMPYEMVADCIHRGLDRRLVDLFEYFDPEPLGAASIGQVHRARLFGGRWVAVKVQYPGIAATLEADLKNLGSALVMARVVADKERLDGYLAELARGLLEEADYENEANNLEKYGPVFRQQPGITCPAVLRELSSRTVLTMELVPGEKLDQALARADQATRDRLGRELSLFYVWMYHERQILHADPHPGNFLLTPDGRIAFLDFGCFREYPAEFTDGWLDILVAKWTHDRAALGAAFERLGYAMMHGGQPADPRQLSELCEIICAPFLYDRDFDWGSWQPRPELEQFLRGNLGFLRYAVPSAALFYYRVAGGVWGMLQRNGVRGNWYRPVRALAERRGRFARGARG